MTLPGKFPPGRPPHRRGPEHPHSTAHGHEGRQRPDASPTDRPRERPTASQHSAKHCMPDYFTWIPKPEPHRTQKNNEKYREKIGSYLKFFLSLHTEKESGRSSVRLEYTSGGRVVAGSNPVTPTDEKSLIFNRISRIFLL